MQMGESPVRYQTRLRAVEAVRLIRSTDWKLDAVARTVGWKTRKDLYRALENVAHTAPARIRALSPQDAAALMVTMGLPATIRGSSVNRPSVPTQS